MGKKFNHLHVPEHWQQYWSKYPEGYTILESLIDWVSQVDEMTKNINDWNSYLDDFVETFDNNLKNSVQGILKEWQDSGFLDVVISEALQWELDTYREITDIKLKKIDERLIYEGVLFSSFEGSDINERFTNAMEYSYLNSVPILVDETNFILNRDININRKCEFIGLPGFKVTLRNGARITYTLGSKGSKISNLTVVGDNTTSALFLDNTEDIELDNIKIQNTLRAGIWLSNCSNITLKNFYIESAWLDTSIVSNGALYIHNSNKIKLLKGTIHGVYSKGVNCGACTDVTMSEVIVYNTLVAEGDGLYCNKCNLVSMIDCFVYGVMGNGVKLSRNTTYTRLYRCNLKVTNDIGNTVRIQGGSHNTVEDCILEKEGLKQTIEITPHTQDENGRAVGNTIKNNRFITFSTGTYVSIYGRQGFVCEDNNILNNRFTGGAYGVVLVRAKNTRIDGNLFKGITIRAINHTNNTIQTIIQNNHFLDNATSIFVFATTSLVVNSNIFKGATENGFIFCEKNVEYLTFSNNNLVGSATLYGVRINDVGSLVVMGNSVDLTSGTISIIAGVGVVSSNFLRADVISLQGTLEKIGNIEKIVGDV